LGGNLLAIAIPRSELGKRSEARNKEIERCISLGADYILMIDNDQAMPIGGLSEILQDSWEYAETDIYIIDAPSKDGQSQTNVTYHPNGEMAWTGFGCAFFKSEVFKKIKKPWFDSSFSYTFEIKKGKYVFTKQDKYKDDNVGEDVDFYFKCLEKGIKIKVLDGFKCIHKEINAAH
jgi:hypothetical protein